MNYTKKISASIAALLLAALSCSSQAATVRYVLDQSNALPDNVDYLTVTISESDDVEGQLDFWVDIQSPLTGIAGDNFGIQKFTFSIAGDLQSSMHPHHGSKGNVPPGLEIAGEHRAFGHSGEHRHHPAPYGVLDSMLMAGDFILPDGWRVQLGKGGHHGGDGSRVRLLGTGYSRQDPLHFTVSGLGLEDVLAGFSAHVAGFEFISGDCAYDRGEHHGSHAHGCRQITSAWFYGDRPVVIPVPAAVWLFGSGLLGMVGVARRRRG